MTSKRLGVIFGMLLATGAMGARGGCGPCGGGIVEDDYPILPPSTDGGAVIDGGPIESDCARVCPGAESCTATTIAVADGGMMPALHCTNRIDCGGAGRRPPGLRSRVGAVNSTTELARGSAAAWLADAAALEAASVDAFRALRRGLVAHRAPKRLLAEASRARRDERRHARAMTALARRRGGATTPLGIDATPLPSLEQLARDNAVQGCVQETFAALVAHHQARRAEDPVARATLARIARDETRHAELSWAIDAWALARLDRAARARVEEARRRAARELVEHPLSGLDPSAREALGLPSPCEAARFARELFESLLS